MKYLSSLFLILALFLSCGADTDTPIKSENKIQKAVAKTERNNTPPNLKSKEAQLVALSGIYLKYSTNGHSKTEEVRAELAKIDHKELAKAKGFVFESTQKSAKLLTKTYLKKPTKKELQLIYQLRFINWNSMSTTAVTESVLEGLDLDKTSDTELLTAYYTMLATPLAANYRQPDQFRQVDIKLDELGLENEKEKGILFYKIASKFAKKYSRYGRIQKDDCNKTKEMSRSFPSINGKNMFEATPPKFEDFNFIMSNNMPNASFKQIHSPSYEKAKAHYLSCKF